MVATLNKSHPVYLYVAMLYVPRERECLLSMFPRSGLTSVWHTSLHIAYYILLCVGGERLRITKVSVSLSVNK